MLIENIRKRIDQFLWRRGYLLKRRLQPLDAVWEQRHLKRFFDEFEIDCVFDVGANKGQYGLMLRREIGYDGLIISFEPYPGAREVLSAAADGDHNWMVEGVALSNSDGCQILNVMKNDVFSSLHPPSHEETQSFEEVNEIEQQITVSTETLKTAYSRLSEKHSFQRPFLKMDTQGHDIAIASHAEKVTRRFIGIQSELAIKRLYDDSPTFREALAIYEKLGFELSALVPNNAGTFPVLVEVDCILIRNNVGTSLG